MAKKYIVTQEFHDYRLGGRLMKEGEQYPPEGAALSSKYIAHMASFKFGGQPILQEVKGKKVKPEVAQEVDADA